jgi:hypothetical protein
MLPYLIEICHHEDPKGLSTACFPFLVHVLRVSTDSDF